MFVRFAWVLSALALVCFATPSPADARGRWSSCRDGACDLPPSKIVKSRSVARHLRVVDDTRVIPHRRVVNHTRVVLHRHVVDHRHLTLYRHRIVHRLTVVHRMNTVHRSQVVHRHQFRSRHFYYPVYTLQHRYVPGYNRWCGCGA